MENFDNEINNYFGDVRVELDELFKLSEIANILTSKYLLLFKLL